MPAKTPAKSRSAKKVVAKVEQVSIPGLPNAPLVSSPAVASAVSTPATDSTTSGLGDAQRSLTPSQKKQRLLEKARLATEKAEQDAANAEKLRRQRLSEFIKKIRGVSDENPEGRISQRQLGHDTGIGFASIRNYEAMENSPGRIKHGTFEKIAKFGGCSVEELRGYVMHGEYRPSVSREDVAAFLRWSSLDDILFVLQAASSAAQQKINEASKAQ